MTESTDAPLDRRQFLISSVAALLALRQSNGQVSASRSVEENGTIALDPERPQFHLLPAKNWMNDPNGPIYFDGHYHLFFQYNPEAPVWGNMSWNHAISTDMLHWTHLPVAMTPTPGGPDEFGVFSGSTFKVGRRVYAVYTATRKSTPEHATIKDGGPPIQESQCLAWSDDKDLRTWHKQSSPIVATPPTEMKITGFRDPSIWKQGNTYYMTVGSGVAKEGGCVLLYRSNDLNRWEYLHKLVEGKWNGKPTPNPCDDGEMWECPDFFALDGKHVLIYSTLGKVFWQSGMFDDAKLKFTPEKTGVLDLGAFYAPKTNVDKNGRRILWGWIPERRSEDAMRKAGWSGMMSLPRVMTLDREGMLQLSILPETKTLRSASIPKTSGKDGSRLLLTACNGELLCAGLAKEFFSLTIGFVSNEILVVQYLPDRQAMLIDETEFPLRAGDSPSVHAFVDASVIELVLMGRVGYTKRFYCNQTQAPDLAVRIVGKGTRVEAWAISPISHNRLTTPAVT
ncbi:glycoside hydrolase family 32 protein [Granulicella aggregans]|uniref:glycoside hydrolase family 32 protein n=1 Tax=Granulicella aggregans TaxID=474949 RepID=UPI0021DFE5B4|nr:glycoside hydrolase family 32 protein [Granulicella aggregans]